MLFSVDAGPVGDADLGAATMVAIKMAVESYRQNKILLWDEQAERVVNWFADEADRVYGMLRENDEAREQRQLFEWIERHGNSATARDVQRSRRYSTAAEADAALPERPHQGDEA